MVPERQKMQWFRQVQDEVDLIFLGSSHVYRQFDPALFDRERGVKEGEPRAVNMGALGMGLNEESYLLRQFLSDPAPSLKWIVVEALPYDLKFQNENDFGLRRLEWHDTQLTWPLLLTIWRSELPEDEKWPLIKRHFEHWWRRSLNLARGVSAVAHQFEGPFSFENRPNLGPGLNGYFPLEVATATKQSRGMHRAFLQDPSKLLQAARALPRLDSGGEPDPNLLALVREMEQLAKEHGVTLVWWLHPNLKRYSGWRQMLANGDIQFLIAHDDPLRYPMFYQPRWHFDLYHLNRKGSEMLTKVFAREFLNLMSQEAVEVTR